MPNFGRDLLSAGRDLLESKLNPDEAARQARMIEQGYRPGLWRGGKSAADGNYFTPDKSAADAFAARHGDGADVREYALRMGNSFDFHGGIRTDQMQPIVDALNANGYSKLAKQIYDLPDDYGGEMPAKMLYHVLDMNTGGDAMRVLQKAGYDTLDAGQEVIALHRAGTIRDANLAQFDPAKGKVDDIFASIAVPLTGSAIGTGTLLSTLTPDAQAAVSNYEQQNGPIGDAGSIQNVEHPYLDAAANFIDKYATTPIIQHPLEGTSNLLRNFGRDRPWQQRASDAIGATMDYAGLPEMIVGAGGNLLLNKIAAQNADQNLLLQKSQ